MEARGGKEIVVASSMLWVSLGGFGNCRIELFELGCTIPTSLRSNRPKGSFKSGGKEEVEGIEQRVCVILAIICFPLLYFRNKYGTIESSLFYAKFFLRMSSITCDLGFSRGISVFDYTRTYQGIPFRLEDHLKRLKCSCDLIGLDFPWSDEEIMQKIFEAISLQFMGDELGVKIFVTGGMGKGSLFQVNKPDYWLEIRELEPIAEQKKLQGIEVKTFFHERFLPNAKTTFYLPAYYAMNSQKDDAEDILYVNQSRHVLEASSSNLFFIKGDQLITPSEGILEGITKQVVIKLAKEFTKVIQRPVSLDELQEMDGVFLTSSTKEIMGIRKIDEQTFTMHPLMRELEKRFHAYIESYILAWQNQSLSFLT